MKAEREVDNLLQKVNMELTILDTLHTVLCLRGETETLVDTYIQEGEADESTAMEANSKVIEEDDETRES